MAMPPNTGTAFAVAGIAVTVMVVLPVLVVVGLYTAITVYAIVKWIGSAPDAANPAVVWLMTLGLVTVFTLLLGVGIGLAGRSMTPRKRKERERLEAEQLAFELAAADETPDRAAAP
jgi:uncharacterized membrane protein YeiB